MHPCYCICKHARWSTAASLVSCILSFPSCDPFAILFNLWICRNLSKCPRDSGTFFYSHSAAMTEDVDDIFQRITAAALLTFESF